MAAVSLARLRETTTMTNSGNMRSSSAPRAGASLSVRLLLTLAVSVACTALLALRNVTLSPDGSAVPAFLDRALGPERPSAPLVRTPERGVEVAVRRDGFGVERKGAGVSLVASGVEASDWTRFEQGVSRRTAFGVQTITHAPGKIEEFLTVSERQGARVWRWRLQSAGLAPRVGHDGAVAFFAGRRLVSGLFVEPVAILDGGGRKITPAGLRWQIDDRGATRWLELRLDDTELPLPYVIDPGIVFRAAAAGNNGGGTSLALTVPSGVLADDLLVAQVTVRGGTGTTITAPGGWTSVLRTDNGTSLAQEIFSHVAAAGDAGATFSWTITSNKASGGVIAYRGVDNSAPIDASGGQSTTNNSNATAPSITTSSANTQLLGFFGMAAGDGGTANWTPPGGMTEQWDQSSTGGGAPSRTSSEGADELRPTAGATGNQSGRQRRQQEQHRPARRAQTRHR